MSMLHHRLLFPAVGVGDKLAFGDGEFAEHSQSKQRKAVGCLRNVAVWPFAHSGFDTIGGKG